MNKFKGLFVFGDRIALEKRDNPARVFALFGESTSISLPRILLDEVEDEVKKSLGEAYDEAREEAEMYMDKVLEDWHDSGLLSYIDAFVEFAELDDKQFVLDVGTGTGAVAKSVKELVRHVVAVDISGAMLSKGEWLDISIVKWDIANALFTKGLFDRVFARMVFHHVLDNLDRAILRCYDLLKDGGRIVVAEGVPPSEDSDVVGWYTEMFKYKERRRTFTTPELEYYLEKNGFRDIKKRVHIMEDFSVKNWLENSGISEGKQTLIYQLHVNADDKIKELYNMRIKDDDCIIRTVNVILSGKK